jgi:hypothetical protein
VKGRLRDISVPFWKERRLATAGIYVMNLVLTETNDTHKAVLEESKKKGDLPRPWTAPDFVERSVCAEIGAYSFQDR